MTSLYVYDISSSFISNLWPNQLFRCVGTFIFLVFHLGFCICIFVMWFSGCYSDPTWFQMSDRLQKGMPPKVGLNSGHPVNHVELLFSYGQLSTFQCRICWMLHRHLFLFIWCGSTLKWYLDNSSEMKSFNYLAFHLTWIIESTLYYVCNPFRILGNDMVCIFLYWFNYDSYFLSFHFREWHGLASSESMESIFI